MPPSVAEWYSLTKSLDLLRRYSNEDHPVSPEEFARIKHEGKELMVFMYENQGVYWWAFEKCDRDDPPVYLNEDPPLDRWVLHCDSFSDFIYTRLFDFYHWYDERLLKLAHGKPLDNGVLEILHSKYTSGPVTRGGFSHAQYRFFHSDQKITIHNVASYSEWYLSAASQSSLRMLLVEIDGIINQQPPVVN